ncbi:MAG: hypothetical protein H6558_06645 [Lewinellaceae bacterium]|nr:hypothetical protein [Lewinellaceae bacterium]
MSILHKLSSSLGRRDEVPNQELAREVAGAEDKKAIKELVDNLANKSKAIQNDCIKVLYEVGALKPGLIAGYTPHFLPLLQSKNNRLQWGAMTALNYISNLKPEEIYAHLSQILAAADKGSVITRDNAVGILINLAARPEYKEEALPLLLEQIQSSPPNQVPMYAERALPVIDAQQREEFVSTLQSRLEDMEKESKRKRVEKVIDLLRV